MAMNLQHHKKKTNTSNSYDNQGFYSNNNNNTNTSNTYYNDQPNNDEYYDDTQHDYDDANYDADTYPQDQWTKQTNDNNTDTNYYYEPPQSVQEKKKFVRPRPKHKSTTSFKLSQPSQPITNTSSQPSNSQQPQPITSTTQKQTQRPRPPSNTNNKFVQDFQTLAAEGLKAAGVGTIGSVIGQQIFNDNIKNIKLPPIYSLDYYKYYFRVDNEYVLRKLTRILLPFLKLNVKEWKRKKINEVSEDNTAPPPNIHNVESYSYQSPIYDINAPDGYLPLMAVVTYIVIMGFVVGYQSGSNNNENVFSPQILIATGSSAFLMLIVEVLLMKIGFYFIGSVATPPFWLDIVCYTGYKLVFVTINLIIYLIFASQFLYYVISIATGIIAAVFMIQTLRPYFRDLSQFASGPLMDNLSHNEPKKTRKIFLGIVGGAQILFIQLMGRYTSI